MPLELRGRVQELLALPGFLLSAHFSSSHSCGCCALRGRELVKRLRDSCLVVVLHEVRLRSNSVCSDQLNGVLLPSLTEAGNAYHLPRTPGFCATKGEGR